MNWSLYSIERNLRNARLVNIFNIRHSINYLISAFKLRKLFTKAVLSFIINKNRKEKANGFINRYPKG